MRIHIVCYEDVNGWILGKISLRLAENLEKMSHTCSISKVPDPSADINHHVCYFDYNGARSSIDTVMITHIDTLGKLERVRDQLLVAEMGICFSSETVARLARKGIPRSKLCYVLPAHDEVMRPRPIVVGLTSKIHDDGRKRESMLVTLADYISPAEVTFKIMGAGWGRIVEALRAKGFHVEYHELFDYELNQRFVPSLDYYLYFGMDEGAMGFIDALAAGVPTIVTPQGYHLDAAGGITHSFMTLEDLVGVFERITADRRKRVESVAAWTWDNYAAKHAEVWSYLLAQRRGLAVPPRALDYRDGLGSVVPRRRTSRRAMDHRPENGSKLPQAADTTVKVLAFYDVKGWAWWHRIRRIQENASRFLDVKAARLGDPYDHKLYDFLIAFDPYLIGNFSGVPWQKIVIGCSCPKFLDSAIHLFGEGKCAALAVNNADMLEAIPDGVRAYCCQNGVDTNLFFPPMFPVEQMTACWVGNSASVGNKGLDLIKEACQRTGTPLIILDREARRDRDSLLTQEQVRDEIYHKASFYLCASEWEGTPNPALEALACGLPVISTSVGNMPELIRSGENGFLVKRTVTDIAAAIEKMRTMDFDAMRRKARESVEDDWSWRTQAIKYETMFLDLRCAQDMLLATDRLNIEGEKYFGEGKMEQASACFSKALELNPEYATAHNNLGACSWMMGDAVKALTHLKKALKLDPLGRETVINLAEVLKGIGCIDAASAVCEYYLQQRGQDGKVRVLLEGIGNGEIMAAKGIA